MRELGFSAKRCLQIGCVSLCMLPFYHTEGYAQNAWLVITGEDPLSDKKIAVVSVEGRTATLAFKCWQGDPDLTVASAVTKSPFKTQEVSRMTVRVDRNTPKELYFAGKEFNGRQAYFSVAGAERGVLDFAKQVERANERIVIMVEDSARMFGIAGASAAFDKFEATCK